MPFNRLLPALCAVALLLAPGVSRADDDDPVDPPASLALIGLETFTYPNGSIKNRNGGSFFDADNSTGNNTFVGHDGTPSKWFAVSGSTSVKSGKLLTSNSSVRRSFNGPVTGTGTDEEAGAIAKDRPCKVVYFRIRMNRAILSTWSGVSFESYGVEKVLFGVPPSTTYTYPAGIQETGVGLSPASYTLANGTDHEVVGKLDTAKGLASLWIDPDLSAAESANAPASTRVLSSTFPVTSVRLGSHGKVTWDNLRITTTWSALADGLPVANTDAATLQRGQKVRLTVLDNDSGPYDGQGLEIIAAPAHGTAVVQADHSILYSHSGDSATLDTFTYRLPSLIPGDKPSQAQVSLTITDAMRVEPSTLRVPGAPPPAAYAAVDAFPGLTFTNPTGIARITNDNKRLFVSERNGKLWLIPDVTAAVPTRHLFLDLAAVVNARQNEVFMDDFNERGFKSFVFHPDYLHNGRFYVGYCLVINGVKQIRLSSFTVSAADPSTADPASELPLITQVHLDVIHNMADLVFGPDGYLYMSCGDEGPQGDGNHNSQRIDKNFWSSVFRLDVDRKPGSLEPNPHPAIAIDSVTGKARYAIPPDNPFIGATSFNNLTVDPAKVRTEIYAMGFRNPWRLNFDPLNGQLWVTDVGVDTMEEIDLVTKGGNYQWGFKEGTLPGPNPAPKGATGTPPLYTYVHGSGPYEGECIIGGMVVRGGRYPALEGRYLFSDYVSGNIWTLQPGATPVVERIAGQGSIVAYDTDPSNGDILMVDIGAGRVRRLVQSANDSSFPDRLSKTGLFADLADLTPNPGLVPYEVNLPFWSDNAVKHRWFAMPGTQSTAAFQTNGNWTLPTGTVWVKHFDMEMERGNPASAKRLETRVLVKTGSGAYGVSYRWNDSGTEAYLAPDEGVSFPLAITDNGVPVPQTWSIPSRSQCMSCHNPSAGSTLSFRTRQLNHPGTLGNASGNFLSLLHDAGYLDQSPPADLPRYIQTGETDYSLEVRARSWLAVNCSYCHQAGGPGVGTFDLSPELGLFDTGIIDGTVSNTANDPANRLIVRGDVAHSAILSRMAVTNGYTRMPPLGSAVTDQAGIDVVRQWILQELPDRSTYDEWRRTNFGPVNPAGDPAADPDGDGATNQFEFLTHTNPGNAFSKWQTKLVPSAGKLLLSYPNLPDRSIRGWTSTDLKHWQPWDIPGNDGIPRAGTGIRTFSITPDAKSRYFRFTLEE